MLDDRPPYLFQPTADVMGAMRFPATATMTPLDLGTATALALEISAWLRLFDLPNAEVGPQRVLEMVPDLEAVVLRRDAIIFLTFDGVDAVRLYVGALGNPAMLAAEDQARALGHSLLTLQPAAIRADLEGMADHGARH